ncbi:MAG: hypothetical protein JW793_01260 [Acidobacteria bacterium]|nr:hypothetical protein [Acidobacteriota bacterium]
MPVLKSPKARNSFLEALRAEIVAGNENLSSWIKHVHERGAIDSLFGLETWLKGIRSFLNMDHLPLADSEKESLLGRSFLSEIKIIRSAVQICETYACDVLSVGHAEEFELEKVIEDKIRKERILDSHTNRFLAQISPVDSMAQLLDSLNDIRISIDAFQRLPNPGFQLFLTLGRSYRQELKNCRYVDMLMSQRFRMQYDLIENKHLTEVLRGIRDEQLQRNVALAILFIFRFLKYLNFVSGDLEHDRTLKHNLVVFSLLHEEMENLANFLKARMLKGKGTGQELRNAADLVAYSLKTESRKVMSRELVFVAREMEPANVYARMENSHGLLLNCFQSGILSLVNAVDPHFDEQKLFPKRVERIAMGDQIRQDLWSLRQWLIELSENETVPDANKIIERLASFKEKSLSSLMYRDWAGFETFMETIAISNNSSEIMARMRKFINFIEDLIQEVSKRGMVRNDIRIQKTEGAR